MYKEQWVMGVSTLSLKSILVTVEPRLKGHLDARPTPLERTFDNVNQNINVLISTPVERPSLLKGNFLMQMGWPHKLGSVVLKRLLS